MAFFSFSTFFPKSFVPETKSPELPDFQVLSSGPQEGLYGGVFSFDRVRQALREGRAGDVRLQCALIEEMLERSPRVAAHWQSRVQSLNKCAWSVKSKKAPDAARALQEEWERLGLSCLIEHLLSAALYGYAGAVLHWREDGGALLGFTPIHPARFHFSAGGAVSLYNASGEAVPLSDFPEHRILFVRKNPIGSPGGAGIGRALLYLSALQQDALNNWARFVEKFGIPLMLGKLPGNSTVQESRRLLQSLKKNGG